MPKQNISATNGGGAPVSGKSGYDVGGRSGGASNLTNAIQNRSVRVVSADSLKRTSTNIKSNEAVQNAKSGTAAKRGALDVKQSKPANVVKIDSNPKTSQGTQAGHAITNDSNHTRTVK